MAYVLLIYILSDTSKDESEICLQQLMTICSGVCAAESYPRDRRDASLGHEFLPSVLYYACASGSVTLFCVLEMTSLSVYFWS